MDDLIEIWREMALGKNRFWKNLYRNRIRYA